MFFSLGNAFIFQHHKKAGESPHILLQAYIFPSWVPQLLFFHGQQNLARPDESPLLYGATNAFKLR